MVIRKTFMTVFLKKTKNIEKKSRKKRKNEKKKMKDKSVDLCDNVCLYISCSIALNNF